MYRSDAAQWRTLRALLDGRLHEVESRVEEMLALPGHDANYVHASLGQLFFLRRDQGRLHELTPSVAEAAERNPGLAVFGAVLAATLAGTGQREEAHRQLERFAADGFAGVPRDFTWMATLSFLTDACAALGDRGHAASLYELLRPHTGRLVVVGWGVACAGAAERYLGMLATTLGRWSEAAAYFDAALALEERIGAAPLAARTRTAYARMLLARGEAGDRAAAAELLGAALRACERQAMEGLAAEIRALAA